ncbi:MAG: DNA repair protein RecN [Flavobacteriales bacterium]
MIFKLSIKNYALIDEVQINFESGFTVMTGETGAGKSIVLGALTLLLGKRADLAQIKDKNKKCIVEAEFLLNDSNLKWLFKENNLDYDQHTIIRRELLPSGKSRAFINDTPVTLQQMQVLAPYIIDIHNQYDTLALFSETYQLHVIDILANTESLLISYTQQLKEYNEAKETLAQLNYKKETFLKDLDYHTFLYNELEEANLSKIQQENLEEEYETLNNTKKIQETLLHVETIFNEENRGTIETLKEARNTLNTLSSYSETYQQLLQRLESLIIELEDINDTIHTIKENTIENPEELFRINNLLETIHQLKQKHRTNSIEELIEIKNQLSLKINNTLTIEDRISEYEQKVLQLNNLLSKTAATLHKKRTEALPIFKEKLEFFIKDLGLEQAKFKFELNQSKTYLNNGTDTLKMLFTANKGMNFGTLIKNASGGELSRIMLAVKAIMAQYKKLPTLIFDEIDTGISGEIANKMGKILLQMSTSMQLISITHLPQIAGKGNHHIKIYKEEKGNQTLTLLKKLNPQERVQEISEMIGGKKISNAVIMHAKQLLN